MPDSRPIILCNLISPTSLPIMTYHCYDLKHGICDGEHLCLYILIYLKAGTLAFACAMPPYHFERLLKPTLADPGHQHYRVVTYSEKVLRAKVHQSAHQLMQGRIERGRQAQLWGGDRDRI